MERGDRDRDRDGIEVRVWDVSWREERGRRGGREVCIYVPDGDEVGRRKLTGV